VCLSIAVAPKLLQLQQQGNMEDRQQDGSSQTVGVKGMHTPPDSAWRVGDVTTATGNDKKLNQLYQLEAEAQAHDHQHLKPGCIRPPLHLHRDCRLHGWCMSTYTGGGVY
jgi:hypothetical protein